MINKDQFCDKKNEKKSLKIKLKTMPHLFDSHELTSYAD